MDLVAVAPASVWQTIGQWGSGFGKVVSDVAAAVAQFVKTLFQGGIGFISNHARDIIFIVGGAALGATAVAVFARLFCLKAPNEDGAPRTAAPVAPATK